MPREKLVRIQHPVFESGLEAAPPSGRTILFFGLIREYKGLDVLLRALADVPDARLVVAGDPLDPVEPLQRLAAGLGVADRVEWRLGFLPDEADPAADGRSYARGLAVPEDRQLGRARDGARPRAPRGGDRRRRPPRRDSRLRRRAASSPPDDPQALAAALRELLDEQDAGEGLRGSRRPLAGRSPGTPPPPRTRRSTARWPREARQSRCSTGCSPCSGSSCSRRSSRGSRSGSCSSRAAR